MIGCRGTGFSDADDKKHSMTGWTTCSASTRGDGAQHRLSLQNAQQAARAAETQYNTLTYKCEQEIRVRQQVMDVLKLERRFIISLAMIAGAVGALGAGLTSEAARWLWAAFLAVVSSGFGEKTTPEALSGPRARGRALDVRKEGAPAACAASWGHPRARIASAVRGRQGNRQAARRAERTKLMDGVLPLIRE